MTGEASVAGRCASHPTRLAAGGCPVCGRPRCAVDAAAYGARGCPVCAGRAASRPAGRTEVAVRGGLAALAAAFPTGWVAAQYVNVHYMSLVWPAVLGMAVSWAALAAAGRSPAVDRRHVLVLAAAAALLGTGLGFRLFGKPVTPVHPWHQVGPPYLAAAVGVLAWPVVFAPSARRREGHPDGSTTWKR